MVNLRSAPRPSLAPLVTMVTLAALAGCSGSPSGPSGGTPTPTPTPSSPIVVFTEAATGFMTTDVYDVDGQIVRFDRSDNALVWLQTGAHYPGFPVSGTAVAGGQFQVRFGSALGGGRRAYFTEGATGTLCNVGLNGSQLVILPTAVNVPR